MKNKYIIIVSTITLIVGVWLFVWPYRISGDCMEPAINDGKLYFLNRALPYLRNYKINDIILFKHEEKVWISRIVALENSTIQIKAGKVVVDGTALADLNRNWTNWTYGTYAINETLKLPKEHVYVLSDNLSAHHDDSRVFGPIAMKSILGIIW